MNIIHRLLGKLLHVCNSKPWCFGNREDFYSLKSRLLERYGTPDGYDIQHIPGKPCWSCDGTGGLYETCGCYKCGGSGWWKHPMWVALKRYRFGRYVFHSPEQRSYTKPKPDVTTIDGYVRHANYSWRQVRRAALLLSLLYNRTVFRQLVSDRWNQFLLVRIAKRRCIDCERHVWSNRRWRCRICEAAMKYAHSDSDPIPF